MNPKQYKISVIKTLQLLKIIKKLDLTINNSQITITNKLSLGNHSLIINYLGNDQFKKFNKKTSYYLYLEITQYFLPIQ